MTRHVLVIIAMFAITSCGGGGAEPAGASTAGGDSGGEESGGDGSGAAGGGSGASEFKLNTSSSARDAHGVEESKIKATATEAAIKFFVVDKDTGPMRGVVISLTSPEGKKYYTGETDAVGYAEVLVPIGKKYDLEYLSLGRKKVSAQVPVADQADLNLKLTMRYKRWRPPPRPKSKVAPPADAPPPEAARFVLKGVEFDTGKAILRNESFARLDEVVEYMTHKPSARIEIAGHSDNVGKAKKNKSLSEKRAESCREYLISKGIDGDRIEAVGYGDEQPIASNDTEAGRQKNRRIEATEFE